MKKIRSLCLGVLVLLLGIGLAGCKKDYEYTIGILQLATHNALDSAREGFIEELARHGLVKDDNVKIVYYNPEGRAEDLNVMSVNIVRECDLVLAIATDAAVAVQAAAKTEGKDIPILFTAVTDPVAAELVASLENPGGNITGTSDINPVKEQVELVKELLPEIKKVGIIYTVKEKNSQVQATIAQGAAEEAGLTALVRTVEEINDISQVVNKLISDGIEALYIPTDNNLAKNLSIVTQITNEAGIPVINAEEGQVLNGGTITLSINYRKLGVQTGAMAAKILLEGASPATMSVKVQGEEDWSVVVNEEVLAIIGLELPQSIKDRLGNK